MAKNGIELLLRQAKQGAHNHADFIRRDGADIEFWRGYCKGLLWYEKQLDLLVQELKGGNDGKDAS